MSEDEQVVPEFDENSSDGVGTDVRESNSDPRVSDLPSDPVPGDPEVHPPAWEDDTFDDVAEEDAGILPETVPEPSNEEVEERLDQDEGPVDGQEGTAGPPTDSEAARHIDMLIRIGQVSLLNRFGEDGSSLAAVSVVELRRINDLFVPPPGFESWRAGGGRRELSRIFMVCGREHSGKRSVVLSIGLELARGEPERLSFVRFRRGGSGAPFLDEFLLSDEAEKRVAEVADGATSRVVFLAEDCISERLIERERLEEPLDDLENRLQDMNSYLILSTEELPDELPDVQLQKITTDGLDLSSVFKTHLARYESGAESVMISPAVAALARDIWPEIAAGFVFPAQIAGFCHKLGELAPFATDDEIRKAASLAATIGRLPLSSWFRGLSLGQRLYALLVFLFQEVARQDLDLIYSSAVAHLQASGLVLEDPRQIGFEDLLDAIHAQVDEVALPEVRGPAFLDGQEDGETREAEDSNSPGEDRDKDPADSSASPVQQVIVFTDRPVEEEVGRQVANYSALLWSLRPLLLQWAEKRESSESWRFRKALGSAIGHLGSTNQQQMLSLLAELVQNGSTGVKAVAGSALGQCFASNPSFLAVGLRLLESWIRNPHPALTWAAGVAIWRAYNGVIEAAVGDGSEPPRHRLVRGAGTSPDQIRKVLDELLRLLEELVRSCSDFTRQTHRIAADVTRQRARDRRDHLELMKRWLKKWSERNLDGASYALRMIARAHPTAAVDLMESWLAKEPSSQLPRVAAVAAVELFRENANRHLRPEAVRQLQRLMPPLLALEQLPFEALGTVMRALRQWHSQEELREVSFKDLLVLANRCREAAAQRFILAVLRFWLEEPGATVETRRVGQLLLARALAMDGLPVGLPGRELALLLFDGSKVEQSALLEEAGRRLHWMLRSMLDSEIRHLGTTNELVASREILPRHRLMTAPRPRLLLPPVEAAAHEPALVLVLSMGRILDLEDALREPWADRLIVAVPPDVQSGIRNDTQASGTTILSIDLGRPDEGLLRILVEAISLRFRSLGDESVEDLGAWLQEDYGLPGAAEDGFWERLESWIGSLDEVGSIDGNSDPARLILCALRWRARVDIAEVVEHLRDWSSDSRDELTRQVAGAATRLLFKLISLSGWRPPAASHACIFDLADGLAGGGWSGAGSVLAAARSLIDEEEWRAVLFGRNGILLPWLRKQIPQFRGELETVAKEWMTPEEENAEVPQAIRAVAELVSRYAAFGDKHELPVLPTSGAYRVLILDADDRARTQGDMAADVAVRVLSATLAGDDSIYPWVVFHLGSTATLMDLGDEVNSSDLLSQGRPRPRLLCPLLESLQIEHVAFVLLLSAAPALDERDLIGSPWLGKVYSFFTEANWRGAGLLTGIPASMVEGGDASQLLHYLTQISQEGFTNEPAATGTH